MRSSRINFAYKTAFYFLLIAASFLAVSAFAPLVNRDVPCEQGWLYKATFGVIGCFNSPDDGAESSPGSGLVEKTIWNPLAKSWLTEEQVNLLKLAYDIGYQDGGEQHASLLQSTLLQESIAGQLGRVGHRTARQSPQMRSQSLTRKEALAHNPNRMLDWQRGAATAGESSKTLLIRLCRQLRV